MSSRYAAHSPASAASLGGGLFQDRITAGAAKTANRSGPSAAESGRMVNLGVTRGNGIVSGWRTAAGEAAAQPRPPPSGSFVYSAWRLSTTRTALPSERWIVLGSLSFTATWMLSTL